MKKIIIDYTETKSKVFFEQIKDRECFYSGGVLYMKILTQDLDSYGISNINAISILNAGLTFFQADEMVNEATKEQLK